MEPKNIGNENHLTNAKRIELVYQAVIKSMLEMHKDMFDPPPFLKTALSTLGEIEEAIYEKYRIEGGD